MSESRLKGVYRIDVSGFECRSVEALVKLSLLEVDGIEGVTTGREGTLLALSNAGSDLRDDVVCAVVESGLAPHDVVFVDAARIMDFEPLTRDEAEVLGLISAPKRPIRAETVQRVSIHVTDGYDPDTILVSAGLPVELAFSEGHGCLGRVVFDSLDVEADLECGGAIVRLPALGPGTYPFRCGRDIVHGTLIAE